MDCVQEYQCQVYQNLCLYYCIRYDTKRHTPNPKPTSGFTIVLLSLYRMTNRVQWIMVDKMVTLGTILSYNALLVSLHHEYITICKTTNPTVIANLL